MRKVAAWLLLGLLILGTAGCSAPASQSEVAVQQTPQPSEAQEALLIPALPEAVIVPAEGARYKIAVIAGESTSAASMRMALGTQDFAAATGMTVSVQGTTGADGAQQAKLILDQLKSGVDAICVDIIDADAVADALKQAKNAGIRVITHGGAALENIDYDIEPVDDEIFGACIMDGLADAMQEQGTYSILVSSGSAAQENAWADAGALHQHQVYPEMTLHSDALRVQAGENADSAYDKAYELLKKYPEIEGLMCTSSQVMRGACAAVEALGLGGKVAVCAPGWPGESKDLLLNGTASCIVTWDPALMGKAMCTLAVKLLRGEAIEEHMDLGVAGYNDLCLREGSERVLEGQAWAAVNADNVAGFEF